MKKALDNSLKPKVIKETKVTNETKIAEVPPVLEKASSVQVTTNNTDDSHMNDQ